MSKEDNKLSEKSVQFLEINSEKRGITRRDAIKHTAVLGLGSTSLFGNGPLPFLDAENKDLITNENSKEGSLDWQLTRVRMDKDDFRSPFIEGYCSRQSLEAGETLNIMVSTNPARKFNIEIFRTGYYGGRGARLMKKMGPFQGSIQETPEPGDRNINVCKWEVSIQLTIPDDWLSGVYIGRLTTIQENSQDPYWQSYIIFIVKDERPADILFQCSDNTWQAYNRWPNDYSLYTNPKGTWGPWNAVSFDRPYGREAQYSAIVNDPLSVGSGEYLLFEYPLAYFLEKHGYDVSYCSNSDMITPERGLKCKSFISVGHDEYWDIQQFRSAEKMRDEGVNLLFLSGNTVGGVSPFKPNGDGIPNRIITRDGPYGDHLPRANKVLLQYPTFPLRGPDEGLLIGARNIRPVNGGGDWIITKPEHWIFEGTNVKKNERIPGLVGWEYMGNPIDKSVVVAEGTAWQGGGNPQHWTATVFTGPKKNFVFNASTIFWVQGLSMPPGHMLPWSHWSRPHGPDTRVQKITHNLLKRAIK